MIQINLLPDVKAQYLKARKLRSLITMISILAISVSVSVLLIGFIVTFGVQRSQLSSVQNSIDNNLKTLQDTPDLDKILTIQNQIDTLASLHAEKPVLSRLFYYDQQSPGYLWQILPNTLRVSQLTINSGEDSSMTIAGTASSIQQINTFVDVLKFTEFTHPESDKKDKVFENVVLQSFGVGNTTNYTISAKYNPLIFAKDGANSITVPSNKITTRSITERPTFEVDQSPSEGVVQ